MHRGLPAPIGGYFKKYWLDVKCIVMTGSSIALSSMIDDSYSSEIEAGGFSRQLATTRR